jgi:tetratricopeptide (TPR) repeat protein
MIKRILILIWTAAYIPVAKVTAQKCTCSIYKEGQNNSAEILLQQPDDYCKALGYQQLTKMFIDQKELDSAETNLKQAETILKKAACKEKDWLTIYKLRSSLHYLRAEYQPAVDYNLKSLSILQGANNQQGQAEVMLNIAQVFGRMGQTDNGLAYLRQSLPIIQKLNPEPGKVDVQLSAGSRFYFFFQDTKAQPLLDSATLFFTEALLTAKQINYKKGMQTGYNKMNSLAYQQKNYRLALLYIDSSIALTKPGEVSNTLATSYGDKGNILLKMGNFNEAKKWADSCLHYFKLIKFPPLIANAESLVAEIADSLGDYKTAYRSLYNEKKITDSLNTADNAKAVAEVEKKYNQAKNEKTIKELSQQKLIYALLGLGGLLVLGLVAFYFRQQALKNKQRILETEQRLNRARMNPHFFFNALTAMQRFAMKENDGKALASSLSKFSHIMRETLESTYKEYVSVKQEVEFLKEYLELQKLRFPQSFTYSLMVDGEMDPSDVMIPSMIIQPFIENSIEHGFAGISYPGEIRVDFRQPGKTVQIEIKDNGKGLAVPGSRNSEHISRASQIIKDRIYLLNIKLKTKADFSIDNNADGKGVTVKIHLPLIYTNENTAG